MLNTLDRNDLPLQKITPLMIMLADSKPRGTEAVMKAALISEILRETQRRGLTHFDLAERSGLPRSAVTGILSGSLQKVTLDRLIRIVEAAGLVAEIKVRRAA